MIGFKSFLISPFELLNVPLIQNSLVNGNTAAPQHRSTFIYSSPSRLHRTLGCLHWSMSLRDTNGWHTGYLKDAFPLNIAIADTTDLSYKIVLHDVLIPNLATMSILVSGLFGFGD